MLRNVEGIVEATPDPLIACDGNEVVVHVNAAAEHLLGLRASALLGQPFTTVLPPRLRAIVAGGIVHYLRARMAPLGGRGVRLAVLEHDGGEVTVDCTVGSSGEGPDEVLVMVLRRIPEALDFTDEPLERLADPSLPSPDTAPSAEVEQLFRFVFDAAPIGLFAFDARGLITACNDYLVRVLGSSKQRMVGVNLLTLKDPQLLECVRETLAGRCASYDGVYVSLTGTMAPYVRVKFAPILGGGVAILEDISEAKRQEREQTRTRALLELLFRTAPLGVAVLDTSFRYVNINDQMSSILGLEPAAHLGRSVLELVPEVLREDADRFLHGVLASVEPALHQVLEGSRFRPELQGRWFDFSVYPVVGPAKEPLGVGVLCEDITVRKKLEEDTARLVRDSKDAIRVRDDFLSIASHELKTPLTPLFLRLAALERQLQRGEAADVHHLKTARTHLMRLTALINDLLDVSRIESGRLSLRREPVELNALLRQVVEGFLGRGKHAVSFEPTPQAEWVLADGHRLEQVLVNLVDNAIKYSPDGGTVQVRIREVGDRALILVRDEGIGIPKEEQGRLFERYFRARNASTRSFGGLGLGLYIARDIVEHHGGSIWVESEVGHGSTFFVSLPLHLSVAPSATQAAEVH